MGRSKKVVVLVDADPVHLSTLSFVLKTRGFRVLAFDSAREAAAEIEASPRPHLPGYSVDVIVSELSLARSGHGSSLARTAHEAACDAPMLLYSRLRADVASWAIVEDVGAAMFLPKPLAVPALIVDRIRMLAARKRGPKIVRRELENLSVEEEKRSA